MNVIKDSVASLNIIENLKKESFYERFALFIWGILIYAIAFKIIFEPINIVIGGSGGLAQIINKLTSIDTTIIVFAILFIIQIISFFALGFKESIKTLPGLIIQPLFLEFASIFVPYIDLSNISLFLIVIIGAILMGLGDGMIIKSGFSVGGFLTVYQIIYKYLRMSIGKASIIINTALVFIGGFFFGFDKILYAIITLYVRANITDRIILGTSECKTFYIITEKEKEVNEFIVSNLEHDATIIDAKGGFTNNKKKVLMCAVPTRQYFLMKEIVREIDKNAFFVATDTYEIVGGK